MTRNLIVLGCAALLAFGVSISGYAGLPPDTDNDGLADTIDTCLVLPNGPLLPTGSCIANEDADNDGYGNPCDLDVNQNGQVDLIDLSNVFLTQGALGTAHDYNCNGQVDLLDLSESFLRQGETPGPSGLACAGTIPCP